MKKADNKSAEQDNSKLRNILCPYFHHPFPTCYCVEMNSIKIARVVRFCRDRYWDCHIYQHNFKKEEISK